MNSDTSLFDEFNTIVSDIAQNLGNLSLDAIESILTPARDALLATEAGTTPPCAAARELVNSADKLYILASTNSKPHDLVPFLERMRELFELSQRVGKQPFTPAALPKDDEPLVPYAYII